MSAPLLRQTEPALDRGDHHFLSHSQMVEWLRKVALPVASGKILDYGAGGQPYRKIFERRGVEYVAADLAPYADLRLDVQLAPDGSVPLPDASFDGVLSSQTLEHVLDPGVYLSECARLLRPGGLLILLAPMQWRHHEVPHDYFRFTKFGLEALLTQRDFVVERFDPCGGVYSLLGQIFLDHLSETGRGNRIVNRAVNSLSLWLDRCIPDRENTLNWMGIARRGNPAGTEATTA